MLMSWNVKHPKSIFMWRKFRVLVTAKSGLLQTERPCIKRHLVATPALLFSDGSRFSEAEACTYLYQAVCWYFIVLAKTWFDNSDGNCRSRPVMLARLFPWNRAVSVLQGRGRLCLRPQCRGYAKKKRRTQPKRIPEHERFTEPVRTAEQLKKGIEFRTGPIVLDCTWFMPNDPRKPFEEFQKQHIPGARFFDLDAICDLSSPYPHMLPTPKAFAQAMGTLDHPPIRPYELDK